MAAELLLASHNPDKLRELRDLLAGLPIRVLSGDDFPGLPQVDEDADTLAANAAKKALSAARYSGLLSLADDTGLFITALGGGPGVRAARFAGEHCSYRDNRLKVLRLLEGVADRRAEFRTCAVLAAPDGVIAVRDGIMPGHITTTERGDNGFGYDSIFEPEGCGRTYAELTDAQKNAFSHRARALAAIQPLLQEIISLT